MRGWTVVADTTVQKGKFLALFLLGFSLGSLLFTLLSIKDVHDAQIAEDRATALARHSDEQLAYLKAVVAADTADCKRILLHLHNPEPEEFRAHRWEGLPPEVQRRLMAEWRAQGVVK